MATASPLYDLVLKGGTLLDPAQDIHAQRDVAFRDGKVAAVAERIDPALATNLVDVSGKLVTPPRSGTTSQTVPSATRSSRSMRSGSGRPLDSYQPAPRSARLSATTSRKATPTAAR